ncbi:acetylcholine receptor subunit alpha-like [Plakobranchus ocellatus]|uniref:Acetylcholine receptor subunit alpha-like n=1 Tax=Plakobranchus ocellatus TaxID=259542 RepID=A0AAV3YE33_9GAST|nr:acetylcholine receptor subunit alpha-like [Plakobranchus ocellatus]
MGVAVSNTPSLVLIIRHCILLILFVLCDGNDNAKRLYDDLLRRSGYNKLIRPVGNNTDKLIVKLGIRLSQLIDIGNWKTEEADRKQLAISTPAGKDNGQCELFESIYHLAV